MILFNRVRVTLTSLAVAATLSFTGATLAEGGLVDGLPSDEYGLDQAHSSVVWKLSHSGFSTYVARFAEFDAALNLDTADFSKSKVDVDIKIASVQTAFPGGDSFNEKVADKVLNAAEHPSILFKSTSVSALSGQNFTIKGDMTMNGQTHPVTLNATLNKSALETPFNKVPVIGFSAETTVDRTVWGVDQYAPVIGANVTIEIQTEFRQKVEEKAG